MFYPHYTPRLDSWLRHVLTRLQARELHLRLFLFHIYEESEPPEDAIVYVNDQYQFPFSFLGESSVERLILEGMDVVVPEISEGFGSIKSIVLNDVAMEGETWERMVRLCPNLEEMDIREAGIAGNLRICSGRLKKLRFECSFEDTSLEIDCPNLVSLCFDHFEITEFRVKNVSSVVEFDFCDMNDDFNAERGYAMWCRIVKLLPLMPELKRLSMHNWCYEFLSSVDSFPEDFMLGNLIFLKLRTDYTERDLIGMAELLKLCPNLETLVLDYPLYRKVNQNLLGEISKEPVILNIPRLKEVKMLNSLGSEGEDTFVTSLKNHGAVLQKLTRSSSV